MVNTKEHKKELLIFLFLVLFPFGHLLSFEASLLGRLVPVIPIDLVAILSLIFLSPKETKTKAFDIFATFWAIAAFSLIFSFGLFSSSQLLVGALYLFRLAAYFSLGLWAISLAKDKIFRNKLLTGLIVISTTSAILGWLQYLFLPDLRPFFEYGWDDHLGRLAGGFLDPGFSSIIFTLGAVFSFSKFLKDKRRIFLFLSLFLTISLVFTYSRAGMLAALASFFYIAATKRKVKNYLIYIGIFLLTLVFLPRGGGEGVRLERVASIYARSQNYSESVDVIKTFPVFGVGYNNLCLLRNEKVGLTGRVSNSCSGFDSSILFVWATTGIVGLISLFYLFIRMYKSVGKDHFGRAFVAGSIALLVHSLFVNSMFYPWVMGFMLLAYSTGFKERNLE